MKYLPLTRHEYLYLLQLLNRHQAELSSVLGTNEEHAKEMNASLLDRMKTPTPDAKLCVIHGNGPLDMEKDAECIVCEDAWQPETCFDCDRLGGPCPTHEPETFAQLGAQVFNQIQKPYSPFDRNPRDGELTPADMEKLGLEPSAESLAEMPEITEEQWATARRRHPK